MEIEHTHCLQKEIIQSPTECGMYIQRKGSEYPVYLPDQAFLSLQDILPLLPVGKTTWWAGVKSGRFPKGIKLGHNTTAWRVGAIRQLLIELSE